MYCGSCMRDNALAAELMAQGHDVILTPFYTPTLTDEPNVSQEKVFFGGISVYLQQRLGLFRKTPWALDRVWDSPFLLKQAARRQIPTSPQFLGEFTVSVLEGERGFQQKEVEKLVHWLKSEPPPDIVSLPFTLLISLAKPIKDAIQRPVCCTLQGEDLFLEGLPEPYRSRSLELIRSNIPHVDAFLPVSEYYAGFMAGYLGIPRDRLHVLPLGINLSGYEAVQRRRTEVFRIGYFARIAPEKGLHVLAEAFRLLRKDIPSAQLDAAGYLAPEHRGYLKQIQASAGGDLRYHGALDREQKIHFLQNLDIFSVPSPYAEPKGIPVLEAMATGLPVVEPRHGAFLEILEKTGGGLLFEPNNPESLAAQLGHIYRNPELGQKLGHAGTQGVREHYSVTRMAQRALEVFEGVAFETANRPR